MEWDKRIDVRKINCRQNEGNLFNNPENNPEERVINELARQINSKKWINRTGIVLNVGQNEKITG